MKTPATGKVCIRFIDGNASAWRDADDVQLDMQGVAMARDDTPEGSPKVMALFVPWMFIHHLEYASAEEAAKTIKEAANKLKLKERGNQSHGVEN